MTEGLEAEWLRSSRFFKGGSENPPQSPFFKGGSEEVPSPQKAFMKRLSKETSILDKSSAEYGSQQLSPIL